MWTSLHGLISYNVSGDQQLINLFAIGHLSVKEVSIFPNVLLSLYIDV